MYNVSLVVCVYNDNYLYHLAIHSSEIRCLLCLEKCSSEMLQKFPFCWIMKTHVVFFALNKYSKI